MPSAKQNCKICLLRLKRFVENCFGHFRIFFQSKVECEISWTLLKTRDDSALTSNATFKQYQQ
jgi:hypothetical protein